MHMCIVFCMYASVQSFCLRNNYFLCLHTLCTSHWSVTSPWIELSHIGQSTSYTVYVYTYIYLLYMFCLPDHRYATTDLRLPLCTLILCPLLPRIVLWVQVGHLIFTWKFMIYIFPVSLDLAVMKVPSLYRIRSSRAQCYMFSLLWVSPPQH